MEDLNNADSLKNLIILVIYILVVDGINFGWFVFAQSSGDVALLRLYNQSE